MKKNTYIFLYIILAIFFVNCVQAQNILILEKTGTKKKTSFKSGDLIRFKLKNDDHFKQDQIVSIKDSSLVFHYNKINIDEIAQIDIRKKRFVAFDLKKYGTLLQGVGIGYIAIDHLNRYVIQGNDYVFDESVWIAGGSIFAIGTGMKLLRPRRFKVDGRNRLRVSNINFQ